MIGYICKYAPIEIFESMGEEVRRIEPETAAFSQAETLIHPNICSFAKGVLEDALRHSYDGIILTTCCDSIRRTYDVLKEQLPNTFLYLLDTPRITKDAGIELYEKRIRSMIQAYEEFSGKKWDEQRFISYLIKKVSEYPAALPVKKEDALNIGILGARAESSLADVLKTHHVNLSFDLTCTGFNRKLLWEAEAPFRGYVRGLLTQFPCMRMETAAGRDDLLQKYAESVDGILYHTIQFCDNYSYEYAWLKNKLKKPLLLLETDYTRQSQGQILTRTEAFLESLSATHPELSLKEKNTEKRVKTMYVMGIDSGSTSTNAVIMNEKKELIAYSVVRTGAKSGESADFILKDVLSRAGIERSELSYIVATGYGRVSIPFADETVTEISCHGHGAHYFNPGIRTILDIGGQDSKAIRLNEKGEVIDFAMNDKCAAGTGRFLEAIARTLEISVEELGPCALKATEDIQITSMCTVFAESEVISLIANNKEKNDIAGGICRSIAGKVYSLLKRVGPEPDYMMTGGVAKNPGVVKAIEEKLGAALYICPEPEIVGAVGAALYALEAASRK